MEELNVKGEAKIKNGLKESFKILNEVCVFRSASCVKELCWTGVRVFSVLCLCAGEGERSGQHV